MQVSGKHGHPGYRYGTYCHSAAPFTQRRPICMYNWMDICTVDGICKAQVDGGDLSARMTSTPRKNWTIRSGVPSQISSTHDHSRRGFLTGTEDDNAEEELDNPSRSSVAKWRKLKSKAKLERIISHSGFKYLDPGAFNLGHRVTLHRPTIAKW
jgi:hypothetical protein